LYAAFHLTTGGGASDGASPSDADGASGASPNGGGASPGAFCANPIDGGRANAIAGARAVPNALPPA
jgi:hypothetical protein